MASPLLSGPARGLPSDCRQACEAQPFSGRSGQTSEAALSMNLRTCISMSDHELQDLRPTPVVCLTIRRAAWS
jgi:hypothetical protein